MSAFDIASVAAAFDFSNTSDLPEAVAAEVAASENEKSRNVAVVVQVVQAAPRSVSAAEVHAALCRLAPEVGDAKLSTIRRYLAEAVKSGQIGKDGQRYCAVTADEPVAGPESTEDFI